MSKRIAIKYMVVLTCILSLASCKVSSDYTTEDMDLPEEFTLPDSVSKGLEKTLIPRHEFFKDSVLSALIQDAFINNFDIRTVNKEMAINEAYYKQSKANFYPRLNLNLLNIEKSWHSHNAKTGPESGWYDHNGKEPPRNGYVSRSVFSSTAVMDWELDIWGKMRNQKRGARALFRQSRVAKRLVQTELIATVAQDYYQLLMLDEQLDVARKNHRFRDSTLTMIELLYDAGEVSALAVQQSQTQVLEASSLISELQEQRAIQQNNLRLLTGKLPGSIDRKVSLTMEKSTYAQVNQLPLYLVQNRPDVLVSRYGLDAANARVGVTQAQRLPSLNIGLEGGLESLLPQNWFNIPGSLLGSVTGGLTAPIFNGRELKTEFEVAQLERDEAEIDFQRTVYTAIVDIQNALISLDRLEDQLEIADVKQLVAQKALNNSRMLFQTGFADYLEVITVQGEAMETELDLVQSKAKLLAERVQLYRALGGGWN